MKTCALLALIALCLAAPVGAQQATDDNFTTVEGLLAACKEPNDSGLRFFCLGHILASVEWLDLVQSPAVSGLDCSPVIDLEMAGEQARTAFVKWAESNPDKWHEPRLTGIGAAFGEAFPCVPVEDTDKP